jgi:predicted phosphodiesterase
MIYGIYSDIHGNLAALNAVLLSMKERGVERKVCLGDVVGYGPFPNECVETVTKESDVVILGNHDIVASEQESLEAFNFYAQNAIQWTQKEMNQDALDVMKQWPYIAQESSCCFVHASPKEPEKWTYVVTLDQAIETFEYFKEAVCFIGHTHLPVIVVEDKTKTNFPYFVVDGFSHKLQQGQRMLVNVGSVGQPRDGVCSSAYGLYNSESGEVEIVRVEYNYQETQQAMKKKGFDEFLIHRLEQGK